MVRMRRLVAVGRRGQRGDGWGKWISLLLLSVVLTETSCGACGYAFGHFTTSTLFSSISAISGDQAIT